jgi:quercetin dioxygenase-like cupin family protein
MDAAKKLLRIDADESGESRFAADEIALSLQEFAPPAAPLLASGAQAAARWVLLQLPLGWVGEPHRAPRRQLFFCLSGAVRVVASTGDTRVLAAGDILVMADTTGKGHKTEVISAVPVEGVMVQLD